MRIAAILGASLALVVTPSVASSAVTHGPAGGTWLGKAAAFDATAKLSAGNRAALVSGPLNCAPSEKASGDRVTVQVTLVERAKAAPAFGAGSWKGACAESRWTAPVRSSRPFAPGPAKACAFGVETKGGTVVDALLWCQTIRLVA